MAAMLVTLEMVVDCSLQPQAELNTAANARADQLHARSLSPPAAGTEAALASHDPVLAPLRAMYARFKAEPLPDRLLQLAVFLD
jgi:hypothetical protein